MNAKILAVAALALPALLGMLPNALRAAEPAAPLRVGLQATIAPFVMPDLQSGLLVDVLRELFASQGVKVEFQPLPNVRMENALERNMIDVATAVKPDVGSRLVFSHWPVTSFHNDAITLKKRIPALDSVADLAKYRVFAFQGASKMLGPAYADAVGKSKDYVEKNIMPSAQLLLDRVDVIVSQPDIFRFYLRQQMHDGIDHDAELAYNDIVMPGGGNRYWFGFRTEAERDLFERGAETIYQSGAVDRIAQHYHDQFGISRDFLLGLDCRFAHTKPKACATLPEPEAQK